MIQRFKTFFGFIFILQVFLPQCMATCSKAQDPTSSDRGYHKSTAAGEDGKNNKMKQALLTLFDRPFEPVFMPKGPDDSVFVMPPHYWVDRYKHLMTKLEALYDSQRVLGVKVKERYIVKDLGDKVFALKDALSFGRDALFASFFENPEQTLVPITTVFLEAPTLEDFLSYAVYVRDRINPYIFIHILLIAISHRPDTSGMSVPCLVESIPELFIDADTLGRAMEEDFVVPASLQTPVVAPLEFVTSSEEDKEQRVAYFREDMAANLNHKQWHVVYSYVPKYEKDRVGELFFYFHQQLMGRYNFERLCNKLVRTLPLENFREPIIEGYFPKLLCPGGKRGVAGRSPNTTMADVIRIKDSLELYVKDMEDWRDRMYEAIRKKQVVTEEGDVLKLDEKSGIEIVGNIAISNYLSVNRPFYGNIHNRGHFILGFAHDPRGLYEEPEGVMGRDQAVSMRDPVFYRWHCFHNNIFLMHKNTLPEYKKEELEFKKIQMKSVEIRTSGSVQKNALYTMWQQDKLDISQGMNFALRRSVTTVLISHLQHQPFSYKIKVKNLGKAKKGIFRIYLAPKFENGLLLPFKEQKDLFIEMDRFFVNLRKGLNIIKRKSEDSSVTIPYETTFGKAEALKTDNSSYDRCGWPHHLLVPKGSAEGFPAQLFVMVTDYKSDIVKDSITFGKRDLFKRGGPLCGQRGKYPDGRPMMYPFDRMPRVDTLEEFLTSNMIVSDVLIYHSNKTVTNY